MAKIKDLPNNAENYHRKGLNAIQTQEYAKAVDNFKKSFAIDHNIESFEEIIEIYLTFDKRKALQKLWQRNFPLLEEFYQEEKLLALWVKSVEMIYPIQIAINKLSQEILFLQMKQANLSYHQASLNKLLERLAFIDSIKTLDSKDYSRFIQNLHQNNSFKFLQLLKTLYFYQDNSLFPFLIAILKIPSIENFIKSDILHYLLKNNYSEVVEYAWFDCMEQIDLAQLVCYKKEDQYKDTLHQIEKYFEKNDPHLKEMAMQQFNLQSLVFYPFLNRIVTHPKDWLTVFLKHYGLDDMYAHTNPQTELYFSKANEELNRLFL